jgi:hypothetical protein
MCASESYDVVVQAFLLLPDICRLKSVNLRCRGHRHVGAATHSRNFKSLH